MLANKVRADKAKASLYPKASQNVHSIGAPLSYVITNMYLNEYVFSRTSIALQREKFTQSLKVFLCPFRPIKTCVGQLAFHSSSRATVCDGTDSPKSTHSQSRLSLNMSRDMQILSSHDSNAFGGLVEEAYAGRRFLSLSIEYIFLNSHLQSDNICFPLFLTYIRNDICFASSNERLGRALP